MKQAEDSFKLRVTKEDNFIIIDILADLNIQNFSKLINRYEELKNILMPIRLLIMSHDNKLIKREKIFIFNYNCINYFITKGNNILIIFSSKLINEEINETVLEIKGDDYTISKLIHSKNYSTRVCKWYPENNPDLYYFKLDSEEAKVLVNELLYNLKLVPHIEKILSMKNLEMLEDKKLYCLQNNNNF